MDIHAVATHTGFFLYKNADDARKGCLMGKPEEPELPPCGGSMYGWLLSITDEDVLTLLMAHGAKVYVKLDVGVVKEMGIDAFIKAFNKAFNKAINPSDASILLELAAESSNYKTVN